MPIDKTRIVMTVFAPIMFPPTGVLAFVKNENGTFQLAAQGNLLSCDPGLFSIEKTLMLIILFRSRYSETGDFIWSTIQDK